MSSQYADHTASGVELRTLQHRVACLERRLARLGTAPGAVHAAPAPTGAPAWPRLALAAALALASLADSPIAVVIGEQLAALADPVAWLR